MLFCFEQEEDVFIEVILRLAKIDTVYKRKDEAIEKFEFCIGNLEQKISVVDIYSEECSETYVFILHYSQGCGKCNLSWKTLESPGISWRRVKLS